MTKRQKEIKLQIIRETRCNDKYMAKDAWKVYREIYDYGYSFWNVVGEIFVIICICLILYLVIFAAKPPQYPNW